MCLLQEKFLLSLCNCTTPFLTVRMSDIKHKKMRMVEHEEILYENTMFSPLCSLRIISYLSHSSMIAQGIKRKDHLFGVFQIFKVDKL